MKIKFASSNNKTQSSVQNREVSFGAGLTPQIARLMLNADSMAISRRLASKGIDSDFKGNNVIAWCSEKTVEIFRELNKRFGLKLDLPVGIYADDFERFDIDEKAATGICNMFPTPLITGSQKLVPGRTVFFNTFDTLIERTPQNQRWQMDWRNINDIADSSCLTKHSATNHFLGIFLHEFAHNAHEGVMLRKFGGDELLRRIEQAKGEQFAQATRGKYADRLSQICRYALTNPLEAVACDVSRVVANSLDAETLMPARNPFLESPYKRISFWQRVKMPQTPEKERPLDEILRNFWNGRFE